MELRDERRGRRVVERLPESVDEAVRHDERADTRHEAGREDARAENRDADHDHPLAAEEVSRESGKGNCNPVDEREHRTHQPELHVRCADRALDGAEKRPVDLPRALLQEKRHPQEGQREPFVVDLFHFRLFAAKSIPQHAPAHKPHAYPEPGEGDHVNVQDWLRFASTMAFQSRSTGASGFGGFG